MAEKITECKLCLKEKQLISGSHIISDFMYYDLFDEKHRLNLLNVNETTLKKSYRQTGQKEGDILCVECETLLSTYEKYAKNVLYTGKISKNESIELINLTQKDGLEYTLCKGVNYRKFKLFLLSILWRASISSMQMFDQISLGNHEEIVRKMIYEGNPGMTSDYPILLFFTKVANNTIQHPQLMKSKSGHKFYVFFIAGMSYHFYINSKDHKLSEEILDKALSPDNGIKLYYVPDNKGLEKVMGINYI